MGSFQHSKWSDSKRYTVEVRWGIFIENLTVLFIPNSGWKYSHTNSCNFAMTLILQDDHLTAGAWAACGYTSLCDTRFINVFINFNFVRNILFVQRYIYIAKAITNQGNKRARRLFHVCAIPDQTVPCLWCKWNFTWNRYLSHWNYLHKLNRTP